MLIAKMRIQSEARLPEVRFCVRDGSAEIRRGSVSHKIATLQPIDEATQAGVCGSWICASPLATSPDPTQLIMCVSDLHIVHDPAVGGHLVKIANSFAAFGALSARLPPQTAEPPEPPSLAAKAPTLPGGKIEAAQLVLAGLTRDAIFVVEMDRIRVDFPMEERSADSLELTLEHLGLRVGQPELDEYDEWCNQEHEAFGEWKGRQLYNRTHWCLESFSVDVTSAGSRTNIMQPSTLDVVVDTCLLPAQAHLPNYKATVDISRLAVTISPHTVVCAAQAINHVLDQHVPTPSNIL